MPYRLAPLLLLALLLGSPPASAAQEERAATFLVHLAAPDDAAPRTRVDGVHDVAPATTPGGAFNRMQAALQTRQSVGTPFTVTLDARIEDGALHANATWSPTGAPAPDAPDLALALFEDTTARRFLHRAPVPAQVQDTSAGDVVISGSIALDAAWDAQRVGVLATARDPDTGEVLQSAAWLAGQDGASVQTRKTPLVLLTTRDACDVCAANEEALRLLASQRGYPESADADAARYLQPFDARALLGIGGGLLVGLALLRRRTA